MNFGTSGGAGDNQKKAWKDIWGSGQGIGTLHDVPTVRESVDLMIKEYQQASERLVIRA
jgi:nitronate monooxygenase